MPCGERRGADGDLDGWLDPIVEVVKVEVEVEVDCRARSVDRLSDGICCGDVSRRWIVGRRR